MTSQQGYPQRATLFRHPVFPGFWPHSATVFQRTGSWLWNRSSHQ
jgi:hypothetical protein